MFLQEIAGKVVAITGAGSGIGRATAKHLATQGALVVLAGRKIEALNEVVSEIVGLGGKAVSCRVDVKIAEDLKRMVKVAIESFGKLDVLINNAGIAPISLMQELRTDDWNEMIDINLKGVLNGIAAALPVFQEQKSGHIVNVISTAGLQKTPTMAVYAGTKNAVRTVTEILRQEAGPKLRVTGVSPGFVKTGLSNSMTDETVKSKIQDQMDLMALAPEAVARAIAFAIAQPADVEIGDIVIRPTAQA